MGGWSRAEGTLDHICGHCGRGVGGQVWAQKRDLVHSQELPVGYLTSCPICDRGTAHVRVGLNEIAAHPSPIPGRHIEHLPPDVDRAYSSARRAVQARSFDGAAMVLRNLISHVAVDLGADRNKRYAFYVDWLNDEGHIPPDSDGLVQQLRRLGNETAHDLIDVEADDVLVALDIADLLLRFRYEAPGRVKARRGEETPEA